MKTKTQMQIFYAEQRKLADANLLFLEMVGDGMTRAELAALIERRPDTWKKFAHWLPKLP